MILNHRSFFTDYLARLKQDGDWLAGVVARQHSGTCMAGGGGEERESHSESQQLVLTIEAAW